MKSLNFVSKKRNLEKIIQDNMAMIRKIQFATPTVQFSAHQ